MALLKYLRREGPVCECGAKTEQVCVSVALSKKKTEQVNKCMSPLVPNGENAKAYQKHDA